MTTTIVIPCFNEARRLDLAQVTAYSSSYPNDRFLFVDDGSSDDTAAVLESYCSEHPETARLLELERNEGKAEAVRRGMNEAMGTNTDAVAFIDADFATPLECIQELGAIMTASPDVRMVFGSRVKLLGLDIRRNPLRHLFGRVFATTVVILLGVSVYDTQCGAKLFKREELVADLFARPFLSRWLFDVEILARFIKSSGLPRDRIGEQVKEWPVSTWHEIPGSKVSLGSWFRSIYDLFRIWRKEM